VREKKRDKPVLGSSEGGVDSIIGRTVVRKRDLRSCENIHNYNITLNIQRTCAALSSKPLSNLSKTLSQPSKALAKFHDMTAFPIVSFVVLTACRDATSEDRNGSKNSTNSVLSVVRSSST
jgi:hypothetical protein